ncbi:hypothetical protein F5Y04DRAFT_75720 [Hypomontagnella monticulosa]|nr:hypothetical protein F5Y04DRAFT_75720 [Hypomontagnella monticulosa]
MLAVATPRVPLHSFLYNDLPSCQQSLLISLLLKVKSIAAIPDPLLVFMLIGMSSAISSHSRSAPQPIPSQDMSNNMKSAAEATKTGKRKGTRSVSTLTPSQLARKRANDREAQRAIRARTKEHIENLEREIEELRNHQDRDQTIQTLLRRNKNLEDELRRLREGMGIRATDSSDQFQSVFHSSSPPRSHSFGQSAHNYPVMQNITSYGSMPDATDVWPGAVPCSISSSVSSPTSSAATDDFGGSNYITTSAPSSVFERSSLPPHARSPTISCVSGESAFDDVKPEFGCPPINIMPINPAYNFQSWNMYPMSQYQASATALGQSHQIPRIGGCPF